MSLLVLVRHGKASAFTGDYDRLSEPGFAQARHLGERWAALDRRVDRLYVGPRRRHRETAETLLEAFAAGGGAAPALEVVDGLDEHQGLRLLMAVFDELRERDDDLGELARAAHADTEDTTALLRLFRAVMRRWVVGELHHADVESYAAFRARVVAASERMTAGLVPGEVAVAVTSAGPVGAAVGHALGLDDAAAADLSFVVQNASVSELQRTRKGLGLFRFNEIGHLTDASLRTFV
ncbi:MAG TPA: phosphoglycerate mutase family protein [Sandaracinaceae bacterium LLY-WYZ-13_1]|nr:phosphoglycerate mutase family protein [Sandaracinaceae bacterium LLY-WYZ-13_1]